MTHQVPWTKTLLEDFIIEGLLLGVLGSIIPIGLSIYGYTALYNLYTVSFFKSLYPALIALASSL